MKSAKDFAQAAGQLADLAEAMRPPEGDRRYAATRNLAVYYIRNAAKHAREIAESIANVENESKP